jgi:hypothetical protein
VQLQRSSDGLSGDALPAGSTVQVKVYASLDNQFDAADVLVGQTSVAAAQFTDPTYQATIGVDTGALHQPGNYKLIGVIDPANTIPESDENNNVFITGTTQQLQASNSFGSVSGTTIPSMTLTDADGTRFTLSISGKGTVQVGQDVDGYSMQINGSDANTQISITASGGDGRVTFDAISANSALKSLALGAVDLNGPLNVAGALGTLALGNATNASISTQGTGSLNLSGQVFNGVRVNTTQALGSVQLNSWKASTTGASLLQATGLNTLQVTNDFSADVSLSGAGVSGLVLGTATVARSAPASGTSMAAPAP